MTLPQVSEEMKRFAGLLAEEVLLWPGVTARPMFGLRAFYRGGAIFAMLPDKRAPEKANAIAYKLAKWRIFEVRGEGDLKAALGWLERAYGKATT